MEKMNLIMLPGWGMQSPVWAAIQNNMEEYCNLFLLEWDDVTAIDSFKQKVMLLIDREKLESFSLLGWSLGSLVAFEIVEAFKEKVEKLVLIGGTSCFTINKAEGYAYGWAKRIVESMKAKLLSHTDKVLTDFYISMFSEEEKLNGYLDSFLKMINSEFRNSNPDSLAVGLDYLIKTDCREKIRDISQPTLLIHGSEDHICPLRAAKYIANSICGAEIRVLDGVGHLPFFTKLDVCTSYINAFLKSEA